MSDRLVREVMTRGFVADERAPRLADRFWPGGLTLVLPSADGD